MDLCCAVEDIYLDSVNTIILKTIYIQLLSFMHVHVYVARYFIEDDLFEISILWLYDFVILLTQKSQSIHVRIESNMYNKKGLGEESIIAGVIIYEELFS